MKTKQFKEVDALVEATKHFITEDSVVYFKNGEVIKGSKDICNWVARSAVAYRTGYVKWLYRTITSGMIIVVVITVTPTIIKKLKKSDSMKVKRSGRYPWNEEA